MSRLLRLFRSLRNWLGVSMGVGGGCCSRIGMMWNQLDSLHIVIIYSASGGFLA
jgi:hypothetical protein